MSDGALFDAVECTNGVRMFIVPRMDNPAELYVSTEDPGIYLTRQQVTELHTALGEWLASTAPEPEAPEPAAPELIPGRRYRVGPTPTYRRGGKEFEFDAAATVTLDDAIPDADGDVLVKDHDGFGCSIDPRHLTLLPEDEPTDRDVERDAQVAELARVVAELGRKVDALTNPDRPAPAVTHIHGRIDRLAARINQLEADGAKPSPLHQAIADEIRRAAGAR